MASLVMHNAHEVDDHVVEVTIEELQNECFIIGAQNLAKYISKQCIRQMMAEIPDHLQVPAPSFSFLGLDLFSPLKVRDDVREKSTRYV